jgi:hypothetical protein
MLFVSTAAAETVTETGELFPTSIRVQQFDDADLDGVWDSGENQIGEMNSENNLIPKGVWMFSQFGQKHWFQTVTIADGIKQDSRSTASVTVKGVTPEEHLIIFGCARLCNVIGATFKDINGNGVFDSPEDAAMPGVEIKIEGKDCFNNKIKSSVKNTDSLGNATWLDMVPGSYTLTVTVPEGSVATTSESCTLKAGPGENAFGGFWLQ